MPTYKTRVVKNDADTYDGQCACGFTTSQWPQKKLAKARIDEHTVEHETQEPMRELHEFRVEHGLTVSADGVVGFADPDNADTDDDEGTE